jgi:hypothetical protein
MQYRGRLQYSFYFNPLGIGLTIGLTIYYLDFIFHRMPTFWTTQGTSASSSISSISSISRLISHRENPVWTSLIQDECVITCYMIPVLEASYAIY